MLKDEKRFIVLTGATRGLGRALTDRFIESGHTVAACGRSEEQLNELRAHYGPPHQFDCVDVADDHQVKRWAARLLAESGTPDLLINNAALINRSRPLWEVPADEFSRVVDVNIKGVANVIRHFVPAMVERRQGVIVNLSSGWGRGTAADVAPYCATKWAVEGLTQAMAQELPAGMAAVPVNPGIINTEMLQTCFGSSAKHFPDATSWSRLAAPFLLRLGSAENGSPETVPTGDDV